MIRYGLHSSEYGFRYVHHDSDGGIGVIDVFPPADGMIMVDLRYKKQGNTRFSSILIPEQAAMELAKWVSTMKS